MRVNLNHVRILMLALSLLMASESAAQSPATPSPAPSGTPHSGPEIPPGDGTPQRRASETLIDASLPDDAALDAMLAPYRAKVHELDRVIGKLDGTLVKGRVVGSSMGNFVTDAVRERARLRLGRPVTMAVLNRDGLRKNIIAPGELRARDIFEMLPFENELVLVELSGAQLRRLLELMMDNGDLAMSGARVTYKTGEKRKFETLSLKLIGPGGASEEIDPARTYSIVTVDYVMQRGGDYEFLKELKDVHPMNIRIRDAVTDYVKAMTAAGKSIRALIDDRYEGPGVSEAEIT